MRSMFSESKFNKDVSKWDIQKLRDFDHMFYHCSAPQPWWYIEDNELRKKAIDSVLFKNELQNTLSINITQPKKVKI